MTKEEQKQFIVDLMELIQRGILARIENGRVPAEWNGIELREYLTRVADKHRAVMSQGRKRDFNNTVLVNNLL